MFKRFHELQQARKHGNRESHSSIMYLRRRRLVIIWSVIFSLCGHSKIVEGALPTCTPASSGRLDVLSSCRISSSSDGKYEFSDLTIERSLLFESTTTNSFHTVNVTGTLKVGILGSLIVDRNRQRGSRNDGATTEGRGSGGSHAGRGGSPKLIKPLKDHATPTGDPMDPKDVGGYGGDGISSGSGGAGGGGIQIWSSKCEISGSIQANGQDGEESQDSGGGAGGTISLECGELLGKPFLEARGGQGNGDGGGGSGGRIRLKFGSGNFKGEQGLHAHGGKVGMLSLH